MLVEPGFFPHQLYQDTESKLQHSCMAQSQWLSCNVSLKPPHLPATMTGVNVLVRPLGYFMCVGMRGLWIRNKVMYSNLWSLVDAKSIFSGLRPFSLSSLC